MKKPMLVKKNIFFVFLGCLLIFSPAALLISKAEAQEQTRGATEQRNDDDLLEKEIVGIQKNLLAQKEHADNEINRLENLVESQNRLIQNLEAQLKSIADKPLTNGTTFEIWSGTLLACVAIMVTILSIMLAFFQYTGLKNVKQESLREAKKVAHQITPKVAERKLLEHIKEGGFNKIIEDAIDKIAFSNINDPENYEENNTDV